MFDKSLQSIVDTTGSEYTLINYFRDFPEIIAIRYDYEKYSYFLVNDTLRSDHDKKYDNFVTLVRFSNENGKYDIKVFRCRNDWKLHDGADCEAVKSCKEITKATATPLELYIIFEKRPEC